MSFKTPPTQFVENTTTLRIHSFDSFVNLREAFRCGLFMTWPGKSDDKPVCQTSATYISYFASHSANNIVVMICDQVSPLFIFNATFPASEECAAGKPNYDRYKSFCSSAVRIEENNLKSKWFLVISIISYLSPSEKNIFSGTKVLRTAV